MSSIGSINQEAFIKHTSNESAKAKMKTILELTFYLSRKIVHM